MRGVYARLMDDVFRQLREINARLSKIEETILLKESPSLAIQESELLSLPDHLRTTFMVVAKMGKVNAKDVSLQTCRSRAAESSYLNQLVRMGRLERSFANRSMSGAHIKTFTLTKNKSPILAKVQE